MGELQIWRDRGRRCDLCFYLAGRRGVIEVAIKNSSECDLIFNLVRTELSMKVCRNPTLRS
jgi:hypothetical protein